MEITGTGQIYLFGCLGGAVVELLRWWKLRESDVFPAYAGRPVYWLLTVAMIGVGGLVAIVYGTESMSAVMAMNLGGSAPALLGALAKQPKGVGADELNFDGKASNTSRLRAFFAFGR